MPTQHSATVKEEKCKVNTKRLETTHGTELEQIEKE
jgi:hypothetical protein